MTGACSSEPLQLDNRISRNPIHTVTFTGWSDPLPRGGTPLTASQIESYEIQVNEVLPSKDINKVDYTSNLISIKMNHAQTEITMNLTSDLPQLFCLTLKVKDFADNVRQSRRFILIDNTTFIETSAAQHFLFTSASPESKFSWQTHRNDVCVSWKEYFFNKYYRDSQLLNGVEPEPNGLITETYEQINGELPVTGTPNVYGIVKYMVSWRMHDGSFTPEIEVPHFLNQTFCESLPLQDGETYTFKVRPVDIIGNTYSDSRTVFIDSSPPVVEELCIQSKQTRTRCDNVTKDTLTLNCTSLDLHSGLLRVQWLFAMHSATNDSREIEISSGEFKWVNTQFLDVCIHKCMISIFHLFKHTTGLIQRVNSVEVVYC